MILTFHAAPFRAVLLKRIRKFTGFGELLTRDLRTLLFDIPRELLLRGKLCLVEILKYFKTPEFFRENDFSSVSPSFFKFLFLFV